MCGIAGFSREDRAKIERMVASLRHRGPDAQGIVVASGASIGNARLAILDPRPEGDQPMWNDEQTVVITYNGEIYNYRQLRDEEGFACRTDTDTEVLLKLYERYGVDFLPRLRGMFSFGLYDTRNRTFHVARGASGILPLFVAYEDGALHFASEMRTLMLALKTKPALHMPSLSRYLRLQYVPGPETLCEGVESLPPGTIISWSEGKETRRTFTPHSPRFVFASRQSFSEAFPHIMADAVSAHLVSDKPVGVFLSGGMDSSIVLHHMVANASGPVKTFTVRFDATEEEGAQRFNTDADLARQTAAHYGTEHREVLLTAELCRQVYRDTARALDQPNADSVAMAQFVLARRAKEEVDVVLCGAAGDELFGGYPRYRIARILRLLRFVPPRLRQLAARLTGHPEDVLGMQPGPTLAERLLARPVSEIIDVARGDWFDPQAITRLFEERFASFGDAAQEDPVRAFMEFDRGLWLVDESLRLADATTMASSVECRVPFLDPAVIAASHATPAHWHVTPRRTKALLKDTYRGILPLHLFALTKASFYPPLAKWIRREAAPLIAEMLENVHIREIFDTDKLRFLHEQHTRREVYALHILSTLTQLAFWFDEVYDA